jgi:hypothetical protein
MCAMATINKEVVIHVPPDLLPDELAPNVDAMMTAGIAAIKKTLESEGGRLAV